MSIGERLQMVIKMNGMTNASFADKIGVQRSSISHVLAGRNKPSIDFIQKILSTFAKVDAGWLITGEKVGRTKDDLSSDETLQQEGSKEEDKKSSFGRLLVKDEDPEPYSDGKSKENKTSQEDIKNKSTGSRRISKVIVFYNDDTFEEVLSID
jgi:transcriptional regulator with XRE-family HTH domain